MVHHPQDKAVKQIIMCSLSFFTYNMGNDIKDDVRYKQTY
ncbi:hypothetical protein GCWU000282_03076 [Catonella morbi ATCC 51271]|uniref:Uncharacterized protein n=1 Tax=Catonella morbi ATCC 51271 TaxID=592026 RepID=V2XHY6_9FIRM|nr:hypothetical protein GCWU000282_03076 [Catonella morbi ATCC 51271]